MVVKFYVLLYVFIIYFKFLCCFLISYLLYVYIYINLFFFYFSYIFLFPYYLTLNLLDNFFAFFILVIFKIDNLWVVRVLTLIHG